MSCYLTGCVSIPPPQAKRFTSIPLCLNVNVLSQPPPCTGSQVQVFVIQFNIFTPSQSSSQLFFELLFARIESPSLQLERTHHPSPPANSRAEQTRRLHTLASLRIRASYTPRRDPTSRIRSGRRIRRSRHARLRGDKSATAYPGDDDRGWAGPSGWVDDAGGL